MTYLDSLNPAQKKAVVTTDGPVLIVAGAGAGKTKTITHRILHLISLGIAPESILAITFTNKAAKEMRDRVLGLLGNDTDFAHLGHRTPLICTFHALGVRIIKENAPLFNLPRHFNIFDKSDSKKVLKEALVYVGVDPKEHLEKIQNIISKEKGRGVRMTEYVQRGAYDYTSELTKKVWQRYEDVLKKEHALDFDDLLLKMLFLLETYPDVRDYYQNRFQYIHIDEYQDTNTVQNKIVEILAQKHNNLCVVGDTDQNIYGWRGAEIKNMLHFEHTYPTVQTIFLEQNYRSTQNILAVANEIISKNNFRIPKKLFTENQTGELIGLYEARNETDEAQFIAIKSKELIESGINPDEIAVLYRANFQSRALEEAFVSCGVSYHMLGTKFFERKEIKDIISYIKLALNPDSTTDFSRIINTPARGLGKVTVEKILDGRENELPPSAQLKLENFRGMLRECRDVILSRKPSESLRYIIERTGMDELYKTGLEEDTERLENIMELVSLSVVYDQYENEEGIEKFLTDSALMSDQDELDENKKGVRLLTVHSSKGLEFDYVFIAGLEGDLFPHKGFGDTKKTGEDSEEERRLFYVAITRARAKVILTYAQTRTIFGTQHVNAPSEFLADIPEQYIEREGYGNVSERKPLFSIDF